MSQTLLPGTSTARPSTPSWTGAFLLAVVVHLLAGLGLWYGGAFRVAPAPAAEPELVRVVFQPLPDEPSAFTELPESLADEKPDEPEFLSNVDSRARDLTPEAAETRPHQEGQAEIPQVAMAPPTPPPVPVAKAEPRPDPKPDPTPAETVSETVLLTRRLTDPVRDLMQSAPPAPTGESDIQQEAAKRLTPGAALGGEISLSTTKWDYAWWLQAFRRDVINNWNAPSGFRYGLIGGWTVVEVEVAPSGKLLGARVLDSEGHKALHEASVRAFTRAATFDPLPPDFPDPTLRIRIKMMYSLRHQP